MALGTLSLLSWITLISCEMSRGSVSLAREIDPSVIIMIMVMSSRADGGINARAKEKRGNYSSAIFDAGISIRPIHLHQ
jgi:hypothetical protein